MLQHLWTGPISNSSVEVVQGSRSVEVRAVGVTKVLSSLVSNNLLHLVILIETSSSIDVPNGLLDLESEIIAPYI
jgi:hypothetical protein